MKLLRKWVRRNLIALQGKVVPIKMASWYINQPGIHSRLCLTNLESINDPTGFQDVPLTVTLFDPQGKRIAQQEHTLQRNHTWGLELNTLADQTHGLVQVALKTDLVRSLRFYMHWYGSDFITSTHEKYSDPLLKPQRPVYYTLHRYSLNTTLKFSLIISNLGLIAYRTRLGLINDTGAVCFSNSITIAPRATLWLDPADYFPQAATFLAGGDGTIYLENRIGTPMVYYAVEDQSQRWQIQHL